MSSESRAQQEKMVAVFLGVQTVDAHCCDSVWDLAEEEEREVGHGFPPCRHGAAAETAA